MPKQLQFILWFIGAYLGLQLIYTGYLWLYNPEIDPATYLTGRALMPFIPGSGLVEVPGMMKVQFQINGKAIVNIKEACNGISVIIALISFLIAFRGNFGAYLLFIPISLFLMIIGNLLRLFALIYIKIDYPSQFEFFHEYVFPAALYAMAFIIMVFWVRKVNQQKT